MFKKFCRAVVGFFSSWRVSHRDAIPPCIQDKLNEIISEPVWNPPAKLYRYQSLDDSATHFYYYFPQHCCDIMSDLYDDQCELLCHPNGGFAGFGWGTCPDDFDRWDANAEVIWEDQRKL